MKTAEEKAASFIIDQCLCGYFSPGEAVVLQKALAKLLKEQDRDTRHACAEAVIQLNTEEVRKDAITSMAHSAIMNTKAV